MITDLTEITISSDWRKKANPTPKPMNAKMTQKASINLFESGLFVSLDITPSSMDMAHPPSGVVEVLSLSYIVIFCLSSIECRIKIC